MIGYVIILKELIINSIYIEYSIYIKDYEMLM